MKTSIRAGLSAAAIGVAMAGLASQAHADAAGCNALSGRTIDAKAIGLPTRGAKVDVAEYIPAADPLPAFCKVRGQIAPVDAAAPPVLFQVNLPDAWNNKAVQEGGSAMNGNLVTGLTPQPDQPPTTPLALARGFVTLGTDGGHPVVRPDVRVFMQNEESFANHAYGAYKKTHDAAADIIAAYYGRRPAHFYYIGLSEGGREGMMMAQRFPADYDGVSAVVPVIGWTGMMLAHYNMWKYQRDGVWFSPAQITLLQQASDGACDELDGLKDGIVSHYAGCPGKVKIERLRCANPADTADSCLSARQVSFINDMRSGLKLDYALAGGVKGYPGWGYGGEAQPQAFSPWRQPATKPAQPDAGLGQNGTGFIRYGVTNDLTYAGDDPFNGNRERIQKVSAMIDAADPDLSAFRARGGKLIMMENSGDYAQSPTRGYDYYRAVTAKMGDVDGFMRLYVNPGVTHGGTGIAGDGSPIPDRIDLLGVLDTWVDKGQAPGVLTVTSYSKTAPMQVAASRPLCRYPMYPRYKAGGDPKLAASYACAR